MDLLLYTAPFILLAIVAVVKINLVLFATDMCEKLQPLKSGSDDLTTKLRVEESVSSRFSVDLCHNGIAHVIDMIDAIYKEWRAFVSRTGMVMQSIRTPKTQEIKCSLSIVGDKVQDLCDVIEICVQIGGCKKGMNILMQKTTSLLTDISLEIKSIQEIRCSFVHGCTLSDEEEELVGQTDKEIRKLNRCIYNFMKFVNESAHIAQLKTPIEDEIRSHVGPAEMTPEMESCIHDITEGVNRRTK